MCLKYSKKNPSFSKTFNNKKHLGFSSPGNCIFFLVCNRTTWEASENSPSDR